MISTHFISPGAHHESLPADALLERAQIFGLVGIVQLVSGPYLVVIRNAELVGELNGAPIYQIVEPELIAYARTTLHLNERQRWFNARFAEMIELVLATGGFYFSPVYDLSRSEQWRAQNAPLVSVGDATSNARGESMFARVCPLFLGRQCVEIIHMRPKVVAVVNYRYLLS